MAYGKKPMMNSPLGRKRGMINPRRKQSLGLPMRKSAMGVRNPMMTPPPMAAPTSRPMGTRPQMGAPRRPGALMSGMRGRSMPTQGGPLRTRRPMARPTGRPMAPVKRRSY